MKKSEYLTLIDKAVEKLLAKNNIVVYTAIQPNKGYKKQCERNKLKNNKRNGTSKTRPKNRRPKERYSLKRPSRRRT